MHNFPDIRRGTRFNEIPAQAWQNVRTASEAIDGIRGGPNLQLNKRGRLLSLRAGQPVRAIMAAVTSGGSAAVFRLIESAADYGDYLVCEPLDGGASVRVARPYLLRRTPFDQQERNGIRYDYVSNIERTATELPEQTPPNQRTEVISPTYQLGDLIVAASVPDSGVAQGEDKITWIDISNRGWKVIYTLMSEHW